MPKSKKALTINPRKRQGVSAKAAKPKAKSRRARSKSSTLPVYATFAGGKGLRFVAAKSRDTACVCLFGNVKFDRFRPEVLETRDAGAVEIARAKPGTVFCFGRDAQIAQADAG